MLCRVAQDGVIEKLADLAYFEGKEPEELRRMKMDEILQLLDEIFFAGQIVPYCTFRWATLDDFDKAKTGSTSAYGCLKSYGPGKFRICIDLAKVSSVMGLLGTLLHEMCHAYLMLYGCDQGQRCQICPKSTIATGHGSAWLIISKLVQEAAYKLHDRTSICLRRMPSFQVDQKLNHTMASFKEIGKHFPSWREGNLLAERRTAWMRRNNVQPDDGDCALHEGVVPVCIHAGLKHCSKDDLLKATLPLPIPHASVI